MGKKDGKRRREGKSGGTEKNDEGEFPKRAGRRQMGRGVHFSRQREVQSHKVGKGPGGKLFTRRERRTVVREEKKNFTGWFRRRGRSQKLDRQLRLTSFHEKRGEGEREEGEKDPANPGFLSWAGGKRGAIVGLLLLP